MYQHIYMHFTTVHFVFACAFFAEGHAPRASPPASERDPDRLLDGDEDGDDEGPKGCWEASKAIVTTPIHPLSPFRTRWDLFVLLLLMYVCITAPVIVCFDVEIVAGEHNIWYCMQQARSGSAPGLR
mmetsp:Transcript_27941/g.70243  ORF Transcript_27941/g.70243 Transcript_27941/m.70243 type:complete len:127 (-) Transcript_27941:538-918(-)